MKVFKYLENLWLGTDNKISLRAVLAIAFSIDFIRNLSHAFFKWDATRSISEISTVLGVEAGLIVGLLGLTAWSNVSNNKIDSTERMNVGSTDPTVKVQKVENIIVSPKTDNSKVVDNPDK